VTPRSPARSSGRRASGSNRRIPNLIYFSEGDPGGRFGTLGRIRAVLDRDLGGIQIVQLAPALDDDSKKFQEDHR
jgi:hypothetical protein